MEQCFYIGQGDFQVPDEYDSVLGSNGFLVPSLSVERIGGGDYVIFEMHAIVRLELLDRSGNSDNFDALMPYKLLGQVIANAHTSSIYVGTFDGKPKFRPKSRVDELWQTIVELTDKQLPGLCPVCGKVVDRRRGETVGHPKNTCSAKHTNKFTNLKAVVRRESVEDAEKETLANTEELQEAVRELRWTNDPSLNERPLRYGGVALLAHKPFGIDAPSQ